VNLKWGGLVIRNSVEVVIGGTFSHAVKYAARRITRLQWMQNRRERLTDVKLHLYVLLRPV